MSKKITLLIIDHDEEYASGLSAFSKSHPAFLESDYIRHGDDIFEKIHLIRPNVIITDFLMPGLDIIALLRRLKESYGNQKPLVIINSLIITAGMMQSASAHGADYFMVKPQPYSEICNTIRDLTESWTVQIPLHTSEEGTIDMKISQFLHCMGIPAHLNGYKYIRSSLKLAIDDISNLDPITRKLYPMVAEKYHKSPQCIERSIRHAIKVSWDRGNKKVINDIFGISPDNLYQGYPTNSEYIAMLADDLRLRLKHNIAI